MGWHGGGSNDNKWQMLSSCQVVTGFCVREWVVEGELTMFLSCHCCPVSQWTQLGQMWDRGYLLWCPTLPNDDQWWMSVIIHHLVATLLSAMWHLDSVLEGWVEGGRWAGSPWLIVSCFCSWVLALSYEQWWMIVSCWVWWHGWGA